MGRIFERTSRVHSTAGPVLHRPTKTQVPPRTAIQSNTVEIERRQCDRDSNKAVPWAESTGSSASVDGRAYHSEIFPKAPHRTKDAPHVAQFGGVVPTSETDGQNS